MSHDKENKWKQNAFLFNIGTTSLGQILKENLTPNTPGAAEPTRAGVLYP